MPRCLARDVARRKLHPALAPVDCQKTAGHSGLHVGTIDGGVWTWGGGDLTGIADAAKRMSEEGVERNTPAEDRIYAILKRHDERFFNLTQLARIDIEARRDLEQLTKRRCSEIEKAQSRASWRFQGIADDMVDLHKRVAALEYAAQLRWWKPWA